MEARIITDRQQWNDFVSASEGCNITQSYEWGELGPHLASSTMRVGVLNDEGKLCAAMLIIITRAPIIHRPYFYAPRGPVIDDPLSPALTMLLNFVKAEARKQGAFMLKVEPGVPDEDERWLEALQKHGFHTTPYAVHIRNEWVLNLQPEEKEILAGMKEKWRYNIRLAGRKGVTVRRGQDQADLETFYKIYETTSERDEFFIHNRAFYEEVKRLYEQDDRFALFLAEYEGKAIAGIIVLRYGPWSWYMYGASSNEQRNLMPNHLLQWNGMQWAKAHGCCYYNFRGIPDILEEGQELWGVYVFKRGFGGYAMRALETHDLVYQPLVYSVYMRLLEVKRRRDEKRQHRVARQPKSEKVVAAVEQ
ncbi:MAG TPA: peptidoglycan bridge formation glycyltransferase FemA/FemB family protein [Ktedonobacteraceae bacterium]|nr:peptidoglycan bridge formation glycyltransferase FemA/FemB family protein [Ktedonobacteraceae bacterium]